MSHDTNHSRSDLVVLFYLQKARHRHTSQLCGTCHLKIQLFFFFLHITAVKKQKYYDYTTLKIYLVEMTSFVSVTELRGNSATTTAVTEPLIQPDT